MQTPRQLAPVLLGIFLAAAAHAQVPEDPEIVWSYDTGG